MQTPNGNQRSAQNPPEWYRLKPMLRPFISYLFTFSLLFMGIEGAVDSVGGEHPHGEEYAHVLDSDDSPSPDSEGNDNHCQHCCHGHTSSISGHLTAMNCDVTDQRFSIYEPHILNFAQAPPTPPPTV